MWSLFKSRTATPVSAQSEMVDGAVSATTAALPIWAKQISNVRQQTETAVVELAARFGGIVEKLDEANFAMP